MGCIGVEIDTDAFGTFSGEIERKDGVRETLRKKIRKTAELCREATLFLASEGSFGPHPYIPFINSDMEALLFWDRESNQEIYVEAIGAANSDKITVQKKDDINFFLERTS